MLNAKAVVTAALTSCAALAHGQATTLAVPPGVRLPADTALSRQLLSALNGLLVLQNQPDVPNPYLPTPSPADAALLDELHGLTTPHRPLESTTYTTQLLNVVVRDSTYCLVQLGSLGVANGAPVLRATYDLLARRTSGRFTFASPLPERTQAWHRTQMGRVTFHYPTILDQPAAKKYARQTALYDKKLRNTTQQTDVFCCADLPEALRLLGLAYKADYAGYAHNSLSAREPQQLLVLYAEGPLAQFDPHDLWHQRLRNVVPPAAINKPVDEGCAYLYGGSWGLSWPTILAQFKARAAAQPGRDWLATYDSFTSFGNNPRRPLPEPYVVNALIIQQLERDQGFGAVRQLVACGKYEAGNDNYFRVLAQVAGITKENFNARVNQLIRDSRP